MSVIGDEIAVLTPDSLCAGAYVYDGEEPFVITAWKDDPTTEEIDGYVTGEEIIFVYWDKSEDMEYFVDLLTSISSVQSDDYYFPSNGGFGAGFAAHRNLQFKPEVQSEIPLVFSLKQNYPNPFNPSTVIKYDLPEQSQIKLTIYNMMGQEVAVLVDGIQSTGCHKAAWIGTNSSGKALSSGLYFAEIKIVGKESGEKFNSVKKMLLVK